MEERQGVDEGLEVFGLVLVALEELLAGDGVGEVGAGEVGLESLGGLVGHLDAVLEDGSGELVGGVGGEPESEVRFGDFWIGGEFLADAFEGGHPGNGQMAVLQHYPISALLSFLDHFFGHWTLSLTERDGFDGFFLGRGEGT